MNAKRPPLRRPNLIDPRQLPTELSLLAARHYEPETYPYTVERLYPVGAVLIYGRPGGGKTTLAFQVELWLSGGADFGNPPDEPGRTLVIDYEGSAHLAINQSKRLAPFGTLDTDYTLTAADLTAPDAPIWLTTQFPGATFGERIAELEKRLLEARNGGHPFALVRIDTMRAFLGAAPAHSNAYEWDSACLIRINQLAMAMGVSIILIHHPNKAGEVSGSTGIAGSVTAVYRLDHEPGAATGTLKCEKNRVGPEQEWPLEWDIARGMWVFSGRLTAAQAANTGHKLAVINFLTEHGPTSGPDIRAALARDGVKEKSAKQAMTRLRNDHRINSGPDGLWFLTDTGTEPLPAAQALPGWGPGTNGEAANPDPPRPASCEVCGEPMTVVEPGQLAHPLCAPDPAAAEYVRTDPLSTEPATNTPGPADDDEDQAADEVKLCHECGEQLTDADPHPYCAPEVPRWPPAFDLIRDTLKRSGMRPIPWIPPAGHAKAEGKQNRDMPQWRAAVDADQSAEAGFKWTRPGLLEEFGPDRLVVMFDRAQFFPSSCNSIPLAANLLFPYGPLEVNPHQLGKTDPKTGEPTGLAGVAEVIVPPWDHPEIAHPMGRRAVPGERMRIVTGLLEDMWKLHERGLLPRPEVTDSFLGRRTVGLLDPFAKGVKEARDKYVGDPVMTAAVKRSSSTVLRLLLPVTARSPWWRPDWRAGLVSQGSYRLWIKAQRATEAGEVVASLERTDAIAFILPEGADPGTWVPHGFTLGSEPGNIHPGDMQVRDSVDLSGIDQARITASGHKRYVTITGPVPLRVWLQRRGGAHA